MTYTEKGYQTHLEVASLELLDMDAEIRVAHYKYDLTKQYRTKANVLYPSVDAFTKSKWVLEIAREVLQTNDIHCWDAMVWVKRAGRNQGVSPHQDGTYWNFLPKTSAFTMWVPLQDVGAFNGSIEYAPGSYRLGQLQHADKPSPNNLLMRGQTVESDLAFNPPVEMPFGCASIHHPFMVHRSAPNDWSEDRFALNFMFVSYECKPIIDSPMEWTVPVSGRHDDKNWRESPAPGKDREANEIAWKLAHAAQRSNYLRMK